MTEMTKAFLTSESQTWATPWSVILALKPEFSFSLDVCAGPTTFKASKFYDEDTDAFTQNWAVDAGDGDAWCNPPYGDKRFPVKEWVKRAHSYRDRLNTVLLLPANKTDQDWFHDLVLTDGEYRPVRGRIGFLDGAGKAVSGNSQGSMLIIFGPFYRPKAPKSFNYKQIRKSMAGPAQEERTK